MRGRGVTEEEGGRERGRERERKGEGGSVRTSLVAKAPVNGQAMSEVETFWIDVSGTTLNPLEIDRLFETESFLS
jgi:hypothetical protein